MITKDKKQPISHDGHRERLSKLVDSAGLEKLSNIQQVEYLLTYIFPRGDVNPLAHRLLKRYGNFANILNATQEDLILIDGINERSARKICHIRQIFKLFAVSSTSKKISIKNFGEFYDMLERLMRYDTTENLYIFAIDHKSNITQTKSIDMQNVRAVGISALDLYGFVSSSRPAHIIIAHSHPNGMAVATDEDEEAVDYMESLLFGFSCDIIDSFVVGQEGIYSQKQKCLVRTFEDTDHTLLKIIKK